MGGEAPSTGKAISQEMQAYTQYLPQLLGITNAAQPGVDMTAAQSAAATAPIYAQSAIDTTNQYGLPYAQAQQGVNASNANAQAALNTSLLTGAGKDQAVASDQLNRLLNPEYYSTRALAGSKSNDLLNSINLGGLSGGETAAVERALNQDNFATGNLGVGNATNTVSNAMNFGNALQSKQTMLGNALGAATNFMNGAQNTAFNPVSTALSGNASNTTPVTSFSPATPSNNVAYSFGSGVMGNQTQVGNNAANNAFQNSQANSPMGMITGILGSLP